MIGIFISNILQPSLYDFRFKSYGSNSGFNVFGDLDHLPIFYLLSHKAGMKYWSLIAKFHKNPSSINEGPKGGGGVYGFTKKIKPIYGLRR